MKSTDLKIYTNKRKHKIVDFYKTDQFVCQDKIKICAWEKKTKSVTYNFHIA